MTTKSELSLQQMKAIVENMTPSERAEYNLAYQYLGKMLADNPNAVLMAMNMRICEHAVYFVEAGLSSADGEDPLTAANYLPWKEAACHPLDIRNAAGELVGQWGYVDKQRVVRRWIKDISRFERWRTLTPNTKDNFLSCLAILKGEIPPPKTNS